MEKIKLCQVVKEITSMLFKTTYRKTQKKMMSDFGFYLQADLQADCCLYYQFFQERNCELNLTQ